LSLADAVAIRDYLNLETTPNAAKRILTQLGACCRWAVSSKLIVMIPRALLFIDCRLIQAANTALVLG